jgi:hypothetical protein
MTGEQLTRFTITGTGFIEEVTAGIDGYLVMPESGIKKRYFSTMQ